MGQYYKIAFKDIDKGIISRNDRKITNYDNYIMAKLMEHSYLGNYLMDSVANMIHNKIYKIAWVGDYADEDVGNFTKGEVKYSEIWGDEKKLINHKNIKLCKKFDYNGKYLVNCTKNVYISFDDYCKDKDLNKDYVISPISILTAIGNGCGGGDYDGSNMNLVGDWTWDEITIVDEEPKDMKKLDVIFEE